MAYSKEKKPLKRFPNITQLFNLLVPKSNSRERKIFGHHFSQNLNTSKNLRKPAFGDIVKRREETYSEPVKNLRWSVVKI